MAAPAPDILSTLMGRRCGTTAAAHHRFRYAPGTRENPLDTPGVTAKARGLMLPVIGARRTDAVIQRVNNLEHLRSVRELAELLAGAA